MTSVYLMWIYIVLTRLTYIHFFRFKTFFEWDKMTLCTFIYYSLQSTELQSSGPSKELDCIYNSHFHTQYPLAHIVGFTNSKLCQAIGFFPFFIRARRHNGLAPSLCTSSVGARTEEQLVRVVWRHTVEELSQCFAAACSVAGPGSRRWGDARRHVLRA